MFALWLYIMVPFYMVVGFVMSVPTSVKYFVYNFETLFETLNLRLIPCGYITGLNQENMLF